jgi:putative spermidine/putrescine transport system substrate-binding protein
MAKTYILSSRDLSRRTVLRSAASIAGTAAITGFPAVHAQEPKVLRYLGTAVNQSADIAKKVKEDTGITIEYIPVSTDDVTKRVITQPNSFDIVDEEYFSLKKVIPSGNLVGMDAKRIKYADKITPIFTRGELPSGKKIGDQGTAPKKVFYLEAQNAKTFSGTPTQWITLIPTVYNADTLGIRPDLV